MSGLESLLEPERPCILRQLEFRRAGWDKGRASGRDVERCLGDYVEVYATGSDREKLADACTSSRGGPTYHWRSCKGLCPQTGALFGA